MSAPTYCYEASYDQESASYYQNAFHGLAKREGKWTTEEETYANRLIDDFKDGVLDLTDGTSLRTYLAKMLNCSTMRVSKKFVGTASVGKKFFRKRSSLKEDADSVKEREERRKSLAKLELTFHQAFVNSSVTKGGSAPAMYYGMMPQASHFPYYASPYGPPMAPPMSAEGPCPGCVTGECQSAVMYGYRVVPSPYMYPQHPYAGHGMYAQAPPAPMVGQKRAAPMPHFQLPPAVQPSHFHVPSEERDPSAKRQRIVSSPRSPCSGAEMMAVPASPASSSDSGASSPSASYSETDSEVDVTEVTEDSELLSHNALDNDLFDLFSLEAGGEISLPVLAPVPEESAAVAGSTSSVTFKFAKQEHSVAVGSSWDLPLLKDEPVAASSSGAGDEDFYSVLLRM